MNRKLLIIPVIFILLILAALAVIYQADHSKKATKAADKVVAVTDRDTGETVYYYPNQNSEVTAGGFTLLNGQELANFLGSDQYQTVVEQINSLIGAKTSQEVSSGTAKVMPGSVKWDLGADILHATIKQDKPYTQFVINIKLQGEGKATVTAQ